MCLYTSCVPRCTFQLSTRLFQLSDASHSPFPTWPWPVPLSLFVHTFPYLFSLSPLSPPLPYTPQPPHPPRSLLSPLQDAALASLKSLNRNDVVEVRAMQHPPQGVKLVIEAVSIMKEIKPRKVQGEKVGTKVS